MRFTIAFIAFIALCLLQFISAKDSSKKKKQASNANDFQGIDNSTNAYDAYLKIEYMQLTFSSINICVGNTPFLLQDPYDKTCLGPNGFTTCDERALWIVTKRPGKKTYSFVSFLSPNVYATCLERKLSGPFGLPLFASDKVGMGSCNKAGAKGWEFEFVDKDHIKLSIQGQCLVRGKKNYKSTPSLQNCKKGEYIPLVYHPTTFHEMGFYLKGADEMCFDGNKFRHCEGRDANKLLWGVGVRYDMWGKSQRYFFNFPLQERDECIVAKGNKVERASCKSSGALQWGLSDGKLSTRNGKMCLVRHNDDTAGLAKCNEANEFISIAAPEVLKLEDLEKALQNPNLSLEQKNALTELLRQYAVSV